MAKPRLTTQQTFFDIFSDWPADDQAQALVVLNELHRQRRKMEKRAAPNELKRVTTLPIYPCGFCAASANDAHAATCPNRPADAVAEATNQARLNLMATGNKAEE